MHTDKAPVVSGDWRAPKGTRVLVAEDDVVSRTLLTYLLRASGCEVDAAADGEEALSRLEHGDYALAFFDLLLPGATGLEVAHQVRAKEGMHASASALKIVAMSTVPLEDVWVSCSAAGMDAFLAKPIQKDDVLRVLQHVLEKAPDSAVTAASSPTAAVDLHPLLQRIGGDVEFVVEIVGSFVTRCPAMLVEIRDALRRSDAEQLVQSAHRLSGSAVEFGADRALGITRELERLGRKGEMTRARKLLPELEVAAAAMLAELKAVRERGRL